MAYQLVDGVYKYTESPSKEAVAWQGYDDFPGIDQYKDTIIKAGTELVKLEPSRSGYFTTREVYESLRKEGKVSAIEMSEGLQVAPWMNPRTNQYEYRSKVSFTVLEHDIVAAYGEQTLANQEYGEGKFVQIYIAGYDGVNRENNESFGLKEIGSEELSDNVISKQEWGIIQDKHEQHLLKRDLFCYQKCKDDLSALMYETSDASVRDFCETQLQEINSCISEYTEDIEQSNEIIGLLNAPTYDEKNSYLNSKTIYRESGEQTEKKIDELNKNLMKKIEGELLKPADQRKMKVDQLLQPYNLNHFIQVSRKICNLEAEMNHINSTSSIVRRMELFKKCSSLLDMQKDIIRNNTGLSKINIISLAKGSVIER
ncbi:hypothetical protein [Paenibacillus fonticola]|uniref:hypothetical protein n=1 Tax=Paenibacillus fonticola TaxID=379896 RepID=UPI0003760BA8|nr:hypothetical protein [Paenibacillus fonticola]